MITDFVIVTVRTAPFEMVPTNNRGLIYTAPAYSHSSVLQAPGSDSRPAGRNVGKHFLTATRTVNAR